MRSILLSLFLAAFPVLASAQSQGGVVSIGANPTGNLELAPAPTIHIIGNDGRIRPAPNGTYEAMGGKKVRTEGGRLAR